MDFTAIWSAVQRRPLHLVIGALVGLLAGILATAASGSVWRSEATLLLDLPPRVDPDRYLENRTARLTSAELLGRVGDELGRSLEDLTRAVEAEVIEETDLIVVGATGASAAEARLVTDRTVNLFVEDARADATTERNAQLQPLLDRIAVVEAQLTDVNSQIAAAIRPYIERSRRADGRIVPIPPIRALDPDLAASRDALQRELQTLVPQRTRLELPVSSPVLVVQDAALPSQPIPVLPWRIALPVGLLAGTLLGIVAAVLNDRLRAGVADPNELAAHFPTPAVEFALPGGREPADLQLLDLQRSGEEALGRLCTRAEILGRPGQPIVIAVVGTNPAARSASVALAMAGHFGRQRLRTIVIDLDDRIGAITRAGQAHDGIEGLLAIAEVGSGRRRRAAEALTPTPLAEVDLIGFDVGDRATLRPVAVNDLIDVVTTELEPDIVIIDGGAALAAAATIQLWRRATAVVLVVPAVRQPTRPLRLLLRQLSTCHDRLIPVVLSRSRRAGKDDPYGQARVEVVSGRP
jgi:Mrp family chromosome partitioning ATPase